MDCLHAAAKATEAAAPKATKAATAAPRPHSAHTNARLRADARSCDGGVREKLAAGVGPQRSSWRWLPIELAALRLSDHQPRFMGEQPENGCYHFATQLGSTGRNSANQMWQLNRKNLN